MDCLLKERMRCDERMKRISNWNEDRQIERSSFFFFYSSFLFVLPILPNPSGYSAMRHSNTHTHPHIKQPFKQTRDYKIVTKTRRRKTATSTANSASPCSAAPPPKSRDPRPPSSPAAESSPRSAPGAALASRTSPRCSPTPAVFSSSRMLARSKIFAYTCIISSFRLNVYARSPAAALPKRRHTSTAGSCPPRRTPS